MKGLQTGDISKSFNLYSNIAQKINTLNCGISITRWSTLQTFNEPLLYGQSDLRNEMPQARKNRIVQLELLEKKSFIVLGVQSSQNCFLKTLYKTRPIKKEAPRKTYDLPNLSKNVVSLLDISLPCFLFLSTSSQNRFTASCHDDVDICSARYSMEK